MAARIARAAAMSPPTTDGGPTLGDLIPDPTEEEVRALLHLVDPDADPMARYDAAEVVWLRLAPDGPDEALVAHHAAVVAG